MRGRPPRALILCPTRELADQIHDSFVNYGRHLRLRHAVIYGGVGQGRQVTALRNGLDVLVATPGRLLDLINQGHVDLSAVETLVLDEADRMLDMGFINDIRRVVSLVPEDRQTLFFSATVSSEIRRLADSMLNDPARIETAPESTTAESITQHLYFVEKVSKPAMLTRLFERGDMGRTLIFTRTKHGADKLTRVLRKAKIKAEAIHGNKSQNARTRAMDAFRAGKIPVLVATDIASRGIDVDEITHVVNYDMPIEPESYVHRIGRTARAGASGIAVSFCSREELPLLRSVEKRTNARPEVQTDVPEFTFTAPAPSRGGSGNRRPDGGPAPRKGGGWQKKNSWSGSAKKNRRRNTTGGNDHPDGSRRFNDPKPTEGSVKPRKNNTSHGERPANTTGGGGGEGSRPWKRSTASPGGHAAGGGGGKPSQGGGKHRPAGGGPKKRGKTGTRSARPEGAGNGGGAKRNHAGGSGRPGNRGKGAGPRGTSGGRG
jgi:ATP-dependent RNA helicase RhlE